MGGDDLLTNVLEAMTYEEWSSARPDYADKLRAQMKRARQTDEVRALTEERDRTQAALVEAQQQLDSLRNELTDNRAAMQKLKLTVALERALREARLQPEWESDIRKQLESSDPDTWAAILQRERRKAQALRGRVAVSGAPRQEQHAIESAPTPRDLLPRPDENVEDWQRRVAVMNRGK